jgi:hypothetical protein
MKRRFARLAIVLVALLLAFTTWRVWLTLDVNRRLGAVRAAGFPINGEELNRWYVAVPDKDNSALVLTQAFALHHTYSDNRSKQVWDFKPPRGRQPLSSAEAALLREYVEMNSAALAKAGEALKLVACRYPIDCSLLAQTPLPHLANLKKLVLLNQYRAELAIQGGDMEGASKAIETMLGLARTLDNEPCLISQLLRINLLKLAVAALARRVNAGPLSLTETTTLAVAFGRTRTTNLVARGLAGDRAIYAPYFRMSKKEAARVTQPSKDGDESVGASLLPCNGPWILGVTGFYELDFRCFLKAMETNIATASLPPPENLRAIGRFARAGEAATKRYRTISGLLLSALAGAVGREDEGIAYHRLATTALAVEQFRNQHGRLPKDFEELSPGVLAEVPEDPFTGADLHYCRTEQGYLIYSVGRDRKDDGGLEESEKKRSSDGKSYDLCFLVER